jgi:hypothetical protein
MSDNAVFRVERTGDEIRLVTIVSEGQQARLTFKPAEAEKLGAILIKAAACAEYERSLSK